MRFLARFVSFFALMAAIGVAIIDSIRFVATSHLEPLALGAVLVWLDVKPETASGLAGNASRGLIDVLLVQPAAPVILVLSLFFWMAGYRRPRLFRPFATTGA